MAKQTKPDPAAALELHRTVMLARIPAPVRPLIVEAARDFDDKIAREREQRRRGGRPKKQKPADDDLEAAELAIDLMAELQRSLTKERES
jgi:hypothetical protein